MGVFKNEATNRLAGRNEREEVGASVCGTHLRNKKGRDESVDLRVMDLDGPTHMLKGPPSLGLVHVVTINTILMSMLLIFVNAMLLFSYYFHVSVVC